MPSAFLCPLLVPSALRAPAPVNQGVRLNLQQPRQQTKAMFAYDPNKQPESKAWLDLPEAERMAAVERHHKAARIKLPNARGHAAFHVMVENQIADGYDPTIRAIARLVQEGLTRHDAVHAIGSAISEQLFEAMKAEQPDAPEVTQAMISAAIERLSAKDWLQQFKR